MGSVNLETYTHRLEINDCVRNTNFQVILLMAENPVQFDRCFTFTSQEYLGVCWYEK